ncbi:MAG: DUF262 domain-containing protein [Bacteroidota bacterium]|nr:DUF262 domain-containing protein [Bacteroidota bacterium]
MQKKQTFTLKEIATWPETREVILPNVQRGFVWKSSQIENLWDSLLRGYPVGAFVLTPNKLERGRFEILDGQQRATAICLGFNKATYRNTKYRVFIDLERPPSTDSREFYFRVITPSHPWGYQKTDNSKTLTADNKRHAMDFFRKHCNIIDPFDSHSLGRVFPYDSTLPIPFELFINSVLNNETNQSLEIQVFNWLIESGLLNDWETEINEIKTDFAENKKSKRKLPLINNIDHIKNRIEDIFTKVKSVLDDDEGQKIPALYLDIDKIDSRNHTLNSTEQIAKSTNEEYDEMEESDPIENLFIRLNDGGTPLRGEELNYSILKANIDKTLQELIEISCKGYIKPARFISIAFRLFQHQKKYEDRDGLSLKIKPKQFQRAINSKQHKKEFLDFLSWILQQENSYDNQTLLSYSKKILTYHDVNCSYGLPHIIVSSIAEKSPEIMFLLLYRIIKKGEKQGDRFLMPSEEHRKMLGVITCLMWLGKSEKQRNYNRLLRNIWPGAESLPKDKFWTSITIQRAMLDSSFNTPLSISELNKIKKLFTDKIRRDTDIIGKRVSDSSQLGFIDNMITYKNRDIVLYSQRHFLSKVISQDHLLLDDTDIPFDWDHISPNSFVYGLQDIPPVIKDWYNSNGNFRAWPYSLNRMDQDVSPALKLDPLNRINHSSIESYEITKNHWTQFLLENNKLSINIKDLKKHLLQWSVCDKSWADCNITNLKEKSNWERIYQLIMERNFELIQKWHVELRIKNLLPRKQADKFSTLLNNNFWFNHFKVNSNRELTKYLKSKLSYDNSMLWITKPINIENNYYHFYLVADKHPLRMLRSNDIMFGFIPSKDNNDSRLFKIPESLKNNYITNGKNHTVNYFTLSSHEDDSYILLVSNILLWLKKYPTIKQRDNLTNEFLSSIKSFYRNKIT